MMDVAVVEVAPVEPTSDAEVQGTSAAEPGTVGSSVSVPMGAAVGGVVVAAEPVAPAEDTSAAEPSEAASAEAPAAPEAEAEREAEAEGEPDAPASPEAEAEPGAEVESAGGGDEAPDPHGLGVAASKLGASSLKTGRAALAVAAVLLGDEERVEVVVEGRLGPDRAVAVYTGARLLIISDRRWKPRVEELAPGPDFSVKGWEEHRMASLTFSDGETTVVIEEINEVALAKEMAKRLREDSGTDAP